MIRIVLVLLFSALPCFGAAAMSSLAQWQRNPGEHGHPQKVYAGGSIIFAISSVGLAYWLGDQAREESGDDPSGLIKTMWVLNSIVVAWDILILTRVTTNRFEHRSNLVDFTDGLQIGLPAVSFVGDVPFVGNLMGFEF